MFTVLLSLSIIMLTFTLSIAVCLSSLRSLSVCLSFCLSVCIFIFSSTYCSSILFAINVFICLSSSVFSLLVSFRFSIFLPIFLFLSHVSNPTPYFLSHLFSTLLGRVPSRRVSKTFFEKSFSRKQFLEIVSSTFWLRKMLSLS